MIILNQENNIMWNDGYLVNIKMDTEDEYQEEERRINPDDSIDVLVNYYPGTGIIQANFLVGDRMSSIELFKGEAEDVIQVFNALVEAIDSGKTMFKIPPTPASRTIKSEVRYHKDSKLKQYVELKSWKKYSKQHPLTNLRKQIVKFNTEENK